MEDNNDMHGVKTFVDEAQGFINRNNLNDSPVAATLGGMFWGMLRAVVECPNCPGHYRTPVMVEGEEYCHCANCDGWWKYTPEAEAPKKGKKGG